MVSRKNGDRDFSFCFHSGKRWRPSALSLNPSDRGVSNSSTVVGAGSSSAKISGWTPNAAELNRDHNRRFTTQNNVRHISAVAFDRMNVLLAPTGTGRCLIYHVADRENSPFDLKKRFWAVTPFRRFRICFSRTLLFSTAQAIRSPVMFMKVRAMSRSLSTPKIKGIPAAEIPDFIMPGPTTVAWRINTVLQITQ